MIFFHDCSEDHCVLLGKRIVAMINLFHGNKASNQVRERCLFFYSVIMSPGILEFALMVNLLCLYSTYGNATEENPVQSSLPLFFLRVTEQFTSIEYIIMH